MKPEMQNSAGWLCSCLAWLFLHAITLRIDEGLRLRWPENSYSGDE